MNRDRLYVIHISESIRQVREFIHDGKEAFLNDAKTQNAVMYSLQTLAESTQRLSESIKSAHPEIEWSRVAGFRNVAVHGYLDIDLDVVWQITEQDLNPLQDAINAMAKELGLS